MSRPELPVAVGPVLGDGPKRLEVEWRDGLPCEAEWLLVYRGLAGAGARGVVLSARMPSGVAARRATHGWPATGPAMFACTIGEDG